MLSTFLLCCQIPVVFYGNKVLPSLFVNSNFPEKIIWLVGRGYDFKYLQWSGHVCHFFALVNWFLWHTGSGSVHMYQYIVTEKATDYTERIPENKGHSIGQSGMPFAPSAGERRFKTPIGLNANGFFLGLLPLALSPFFSRLTSVQLLRGHISFSRR